MDYKGATFKDCEVVLDGNSFEGCRFENVVFSYSGGQFTMRGCELIKFTISLGGDLAMGLERLRRLSHAGGPHMVKTLVEGLTKILRTPPSGESPTIQ